MNAADRETTSEAESVEAQLRRAQEALGESLARQERLVEQGYRDGQVAVYRALLSTCLFHLGTDDPDYGKAAWLTSQTDLYIRLRIVSGMLGTNDWPEDAALGDVLENHVLRPLLSQMDTLRNLLETMFLVADPAWYAGEEGQVWSGYLQAVRDVLRGLEAAEQGSGFTDGVGEDSPTEAPTAPVPALPPVLDISISPDAERGCVRLAFSNPTEWMNLPVEQARELGRALVEQAEAIGAVAALGGLEAPDKELVEKDGTLPVCQASRGDGECGWERCPQSRDEEPQRSGRSCPLDNTCWACLGDESGPECHYTGRVPHTPLQRVQAVYGWPQGMELPVDAQDGSG